ncbi:MAG: zf-TFIIB domain-containing protein [Pseudomonadota bacterium]
MEEVNGKDEAKQCPQCAEALRTDAFRANPYEICFYCGGAWVPKGMLTAIGVPIPVLQIDRETERQCPGCVKRLWPGCIADVEIEFCKQCESIWFDGEELDRVAKSYRAETDWGQVRQEVSALLEFIRSVRRLMSLVKGVAG